VSVRAAVPDDAVAVLAVWRDLLAPPGSGRHVARFSGVPDVVGVRHRLEDLVTDPERRILVAELDGELVGAVHLELARLTPLHEVTGVRLSFLHVLPTHRRRGVGHALLAAATDFATPRGADHVVVDVLPGARDAQRFLARLGLAQLLIQRSATIAAVRRVLALEPPPGHDRRGRPLRHRLAMRPPAPLGRADAVGALAVRHAPAAGGR
jgi:GNAT superfamily N-acetyltransferase